MTAAVVAPDAANPPAVPKAAPLKPPTRTLAPTDAFLISSPSNFGIDTENVLKLYSRNFVTSL
ncbi:hypothetical protein NXY41_21715 [Bacteroides fragilis]|nr:hypothetical protein [Bacteroides fragilis]MCS2881151.1 hypothetical protein [Bacteroides fragilis]